MLVLLIWLVLRKLARNDFYFVIILPLRVAAVIVVVVVVGEVGSHYNCVQKALLFRTEKDPFVFVQI